MLRLTRSFCLLNHRASFPAAFARMFAADSSHASEPRTHHIRECAKKIFAAGVEAVLPSQMVKGALNVKGNILCVNGQQYTLDKNVHIAAFGKAVAGMVQAAEEVLKEHIIGGIASVPCGIQRTQVDPKREALSPGLGSRVKEIEGAKNNLPDSASLQAATEISTLVSKLTDCDILLVLISGGGSALLPAPVPPVTLDEKVKVIKLLAGRGATIEQLNTVRKNLSTLKGGRLAAMAHPAKVISLILSDIIGDPLDLIASGPTVPDYSTPKECMDIFKEYGITTADIPSSVFDAFKKSLDSVNSSSMKQSSGFSHVNNVVIGSNKIAVAAANKMAVVLGFVTMNISIAIDGEARCVGAAFVDLARYVCERYVSGSSSLVGSAAECLKVSKEKSQELEDALEKAVYGNKPVCFIGAGETTVTIKGSGKGGRNQELSLSASIAMKESQDLQRAHQDGFRVILLSAGTDGQDGPTDAAGAIADLSQVSRATQAGLDPMTFLDNNDSYTFFSSLDNGKDLVVTGLTGTNVMDIQILLVYPPHTSS